MYILISFHCDGLRATTYICNTEKLTPEQKKIVDLALAEKKAVEGSRLLFSDEDFPALVETDAEGYSEDWIVELPTDSIVIEDSISLINTG